MQNDIMTTVQNSQTLEKTETSLCEKYAAQISLFNGTREYEMKYVDHVFGIDEKSLASHITSKAWSPGLFKENPEAGALRRHRCIDNFLSAEIFAVDIDEGCSLDEAISIVKREKLAALIGTTRNHQKPKTIASGKVKLPCDRFRVIFFLSSRIYSDAHYKSVFEKAKLLFPSCDEACKDASRFYFPCTQIVFSNLGTKFQVGLPPFPQPPGDLISRSTSSNALNAPIMRDETTEEVFENQPKGMLYKKTLDFITHGAPDGQWHVRLIAALFNLKSAGYSQEEARIQIQKASLSAHGKLDEKDFKQIKDVYEKRIAKSPRRQSIHADSQDEIADAVSFNLSNVVQMSTVKEKSIDFLWEPYIAKGFVTLFTGDPGSGKSTITVHIISAVSNGDRFWDGKEVSKGNVVIFTAEDPLEEVLKPRLSKARADAENVFAFTLPLEFDDVGKQTIRETISKFEPTLLVIDPLVAYVGAGTDTSKANEVRAKMLFLSELTREFNLAILVIRHCAKGSGRENTPLIYRGHGSIDFVAAVRSEIMLICDPQNKQGRFFGHTKSNLTPLGATLYFNMTSDGPVLDRIDEKSLAELCASEIGENAAGNKINEVVDSIHEILKDGPVLKKLFIQELKEAGFTDTTIRRGVDFIGTIQNTRITFVGQTRGAGVWVVCTAAQGQSLKEAKFEHLEQLNDWLLNHDLQGAQIPCAKSPDSKPSLKGLV